MLFAMPEVIEANKVSIRKLFSIQRFADDSRQGKINIRWLSRICRELDQHRWKRDPWPAPSSSTYLKLQVGAPLMVTGTRRAQLSQNSLAELVIIKCCLLS